MELFEWKESFSVGNELMDTHHRLFFEMVKEFSKFEDKNNHEAIMDRIDFLIEYATMHLAAEEKLMLQANYPGFDNHKATHDAFTRQLLFIKDAFDKDQTSVSADNILKIMQDWLMNHIMGSDKLYMPYVEKLKNQPQ